MNRALLYLYGSLLKRRLLEFGRGLQRPTALLSVPAVAGLFGLLFRYRHHEFFGRLLEAHTLAGCAFLMAGASLCKGFWQRGLVFEPADIEFLFTSPFSQPQLIGYQLLPQYLYAVVQGVGAAALFAPHLAHAWLGAIALTLFQGLCFHFATGASLFAGTLSPEVHQRLRWMLLGLSAFLAALVFRLAWDIRFVPEWLTGPAAQALFYPAVTLPELAQSPALHVWALRLGAGVPAGIDGCGKGLTWVLGLALGAGVSLWGVFRLKANLFEASLVTTTQSAERRQRVAQGRDLAAAARREAPSADLPRWPFFGGVGALVWKNALVARRSRRELLTALLLVLLCAWGIAALTRSVFAQAPAPSDERALLAARGFNLGMASCLAFLAFILQRLFPFDFQRDGYHLEAFRALPAGPWRLVLSEIAVPVGLVLLCQAICLAPLVLFGRMSWALLLALVLAYPAIAFGVSAVWNTHYVLTARRRVGHPAQGGTAVATLLVVVFSFLVFAPAVWVLNHLGQHAGAAARSGNIQPDDFPLLGGIFQDGFPTAAAAALGVQYAMDLLLLLLLARMFGRFEAARREG